MQTLSIADSPASISKYESTKGSTMTMTSNIPSFQLPFQQCISDTTGSTSSSDDDESVPTNEPQLQVPVFETLNSKIHRLLSYEKLDDMQQQSESLQACTLSLRTRLPLLLNNTEHEQINPGSNTQSALALLRATQYVDRLEKGLCVESNNESLDEQLRIVLSGLDVPSLPESSRNNLSFRLSSWVHGFDLPVGAVARTVLEAKDQDPQKRALIVEVEPIVEFRTGDMTSVDYARRAAKACTVTIKKCKHVSCSIGSGAGIIGEGSIQIQISPLDTRNMLDSKGKQLYLQIKEIRLCQLNASPAKPAMNIDLYTSHNHGDSGITVTSTFKTCTTVDNAIPILQIELCMAPPQVDW